MEKGTFTLGNIILNRYPAISTLTHQATEPGRVQQNFQQLEIESSDMEAPPCFNYNAEANPQMETSRKGPRADSIQNGKGTTVTSSWVTPMDPVDDIQSPTRKSTSTINVHSQDSHSSKTDRLNKSKVQGNWLTRLSHYINTGFPCDKKNLPRDLHKYWNDRETLSINLKMNTKLNTTHMTTIQHLMSEHCYDSISNRSARPEENTAQKKYLTRLLDHNNIELLCDKERSLTDLPESWSRKELLHNRPELINREQIIPMTYREFYILSRPLKVMAHLYWHTEKEVHLLSGPSELQPVTIALPHNDYGIITQYTPREKDQDLPQLLSTSEAQVPHREPATAMSQALITSYIPWVDQSNMEMVFTPKVYRRTRSMLKIRSTDVRQTRHNYSQLTEIEKAKFQNPFTYNDERNFVECNPVKKISDDLVYPTKDTSSASILSELEEREEITEDVPAPADIPAPAHTLETVEEQPYTPGPRKSMRKNLGRPASTFSDFYM